jgi:hypothetical protein
MMAAVAGLAIWLSEDELGTVNFGLFRSAKLAKPLGQREIWGKL